MSESIDELREQLEEFALHLKPGTTKGKHRTAIFDTVELAELVQALLDRATVEARQSERHQLYKELKAARIHQQFDDGSSMFHPERLVDILDALKAGTPEEQK